MAFYTKLQKNNGCIGPVARKRVRVTVKDGILEARCEKNPGFWLKVAMPTSLPTKIEHVQGAFDGSYNEPDLTVEFRTNGEVRVDCKNNLGYWLKLDLSDYPWPGRK